MRNVLIGMNTQQTRNIVKYCKSSWIQFVYDTDEYRYVKHSLHCILLDKIDLL